jgi:hypothetical protein
MLDQQLKQLHRPALEYPFIEEGDILSLSKIQHSTSYSIQFQTTKRTNHLIFLHRCQSDDAATTHDMFYVYLIDPTETVQIQISDRWINAPYTATTFWSRARMVFS